MEKQEKIPDTVIELQIIQVFEDSKIPYRKAMSILDMTKSTLASLATAHPVKKLIGEELNQTLPYLTD